MTGTEKPRVFRVKRTGEWFVRYRSHQSQPYLSWRDAYDHAFNWARVRHIQGAQA